MKKINPIILLKILAISVGILPLLWLVYLTLTNQLGADPAKDIQHFTGTTTINFLMATLLISPIVQISHWNILNRLKRTVGLTTFFGQSLMFSAIYYLNSREMSHYFSMKSLAGCI